MVNQANAQYVKIDKHREPYTVHYNALRDRVYSKWKESGVLGTLLKGSTLCGGYGDKLKVSMPDEFDLLIHLEFPENDKIIVKADASKKGNVILDMTKVMEIIGSQEHNKPVFDLLQKIVNKKKQLLEDKLNSLLQSIMTQTLNKMGNQIEVADRISRLEYKKCGPAHTIFVKGPCEYSVDFVPAIRLSAAQVVLAPEQRRHFGDTLYWDAIPKPMKPAKTDNASFRASFYEAERSLLLGKQFLKPAIRLLKQNRNVKNKANLKSYHIKTLFLWQVVQQDATYWSNSPKDIFIEMLGKLADSLALTPRKGKLPFFWDPKLDMFAELTDSQRTDLFNHFRKCEYTFRKDDGNVNDCTENNVHCSFSMNATNNFKL
ncbi:GM21642 [Drosophila sechellia]|uniref:GM21642 n=2 Tax=Drosophila sechellia TaxID=7238 RepID=B4HSF9_DROSE|nr:GM21642 [Drosophila sechellia]